MLVFLLMHLFVCVSVEDILDGVSGLTVDSPDESLEEGPQLGQQTPEDLQENRTFIEIGEKVECFGLSKSVGNSCSHTIKQ